MSPGEGCDGRRSGEWPPDQPGHRSLRQGDGRNWWRTIGVLLSVVVLAGGLFLLGAIVILWIGMANYGSNK